MTTNKLKIIAPVAGAVITGGAGYLAGSQQSRTAIEVAKKLGKGKKVLAIAPDGGEKYISMGLYD